MESVFEIIAEPNRRAILSLLAESEQSVSDIEQALKIPQTTVSKHLRILRDGGFVSVSVDAQRRLYRLNSEPFAELDGWLAQFRHYWSRQIDKLEKHLDALNKEDENG